MTPNYILRHTSVSYTHLAVTGEVEEEPAEHMLTVSYPTTVKLSIDGEEQTIANLIGAYKEDVYKRQLPGQNAKMHCTVTIG